MIKELAEERIRWLNEFLSEDDLKEMKMEPSRWLLDLRRWQVHNLAQKAVGNEPLYDPELDERFIK